MAKVPDVSCSIERCLGVLGERWTFLILREAFFGVTKFADFRDRLGVAPDVLTDRLITLVAHDVLAREPYKEPGARSRFAYRLTPAGRELAVVLSALQQWGDEHLPRAEGPSMLRRVAGTDRPVHVGYIDPDGREVPRDGVDLIPTQALPNAGQKLGFSKKTRRGGYLRPATIFGTKRDAISYSRSAARNQYLSERDLRADKH